MRPARSTLIKTALNQIVTGQAADIDVAVGATFAGPISTTMKRSAGDAAVLSFGATGQLFRHITEPTRLPIFLGRTLTTKNAGRRWRRHTETPGELQRARALAQDCDVRALRRDAPSGMLGKVASAIVPRRFLESPCLRR